MNDDALRSTGDEIRALVDSLQGIADWQWDGRFGTALAEFAVAEKDAILGTLEAHFASRWDASGIEDAPDVAREIVSALGGLMPGQLLYLSGSDPEPAPEGSAVLFCAWWPWGGGQRISIRIGSYGRGLDADEKAQLTAALRRGFGV